MLPGVGLVAKSIWTFQFWNNLIKFSWIWYNFLKLLITFISQSGPLNIHNTMWPEKAENLNFDSDVSWHTNQIIINVEKIRKGIKIKVKHTNLTSTTLGPKICFQIYDKISNNHFNSKVKYSKLQGKHKNWRLIK